jgi:hypothetical protein
MKINYGVHKRDGKSSESINGKLEGDFDWDSDEDHKKIRKIIMEKHPDYNLHGYCICHDDSNHQEDSLRYTTAFKWE